MNFHFPVSSSEECQKLCQVGKYVCQAVKLLSNFGSNLTVSAKGEKLVFLYGSNMNFCETKAEALSAQGRSMGFSVTSLSLNDVLLTPEMLQKVDYVVILSSTYNGLPPDNAVDFCKWIEEDSPHTRSVLKGLKYCVFGAGDSNWASTFQDVPKKIDDYLFELGAERMLERGLGDANVDLDEKFDEWKHQV